MRGGGGALIRREVGWGFELVKPGNMWARSNEYLHVNELSELL